MKKETSQWGKDVRKAVIDKDMTIKQLAESIGYSYGLQISHALETGFIPDMGNWQKRLQQLLAVPQYRNQQRLPHRAETP